MSVFRDLCIWLGIPAYGFLCYTFGRWREEGKERDPWHRFK